MTQTSQLQCVSILCSLTLSTLIIGCADKKKELEPRPDVRPMVNAIQQAEQDWIWITGQRWLLSTIEDNPPINGSIIALEFKEHTWLDGDAGCNRYTASYDRKAEAGLKINEILSTRMFCNDPAGIMQQEARYFQLLKQVDAYHAQPDLLSLLSDGVVVLSFGIDPVPQTP